MCMYMWGSIDMKLQSLSEALGYALIKVCVQEFCSIAKTSCAIRGLALSPVIVYLVSACIHLVICNRKRTPKYAVYIQICSFQCMPNQDTLDMILSVTKSLPIPMPMWQNKPSLLNQGPAPAQA